MEILGADNGARAASPVSSRRAGRSSSSAARRSGPICRPDPSTTTACTTSLPTAALSSSRSAPALGATRWSTSSTQAVVVTVGLAMKVAGDHPRCFRPFRRRAPKRALRHDALPDAQARHRRPRRPPPLLPAHARFLEAVAAVCFRRCFRCSSWSISRGRPEPGRPPGSAARDCGSGGGSS